MGQKEARKEMKDILHHCHYRYSMWCICSVNICWTLLLLKIINRPRVCLIHFLTFIFPRYFIAQQFNSLRIERQLPLIRMYFNYCCSSISLSVALKKTTTNDWQMIIYHDNFSMTQKYRIWSRSASLSSSFESFLGETLVVKWEQSIVMTEPSLLL